MQRSKSVTTCMHELSESARRALCEFDGAQRIVVAMQRSNAFKEGLIFAPNESDVSSEINACIMLREPWSCKCR